MNKILGIIDYYSHNENLTNKVINDFLEEAKIKRVCIFGAGIFGMSMANHLKNEGIKVSFFCDNDANKCNGQFNYKGIPCYSYEKLKTLRDKTVVLICAAKALEIARQLELDNIRYYLPFERKLINRKFWQENNISDFRDEIIKSYGFFEDGLSRKIYVKCLDVWFSGKLELFNDVCTPDQYFLNEATPPPPLEN